MPTGADRNLLFGILALQMDFIKKDALIQAMQAWVFDKNKPLGDILASQEALRPEHRLLLDGLVEAHLKQHGNDPHQSLAALSSVGSAHQELEKIADPDVQGTLEQLARPRAVDEFATRSQSVGESTSAGVRFRILRPHAKGGLGEVFVAEDSELHREIALKQIQERHADDPHSQARFILEAEVTGGLEHPGIVPVYGLGQYADGRPFYAMRFVRGDSLKDAIARYHKRPAENVSTPGGPGERAVQFRKLLGRFIDVCNAIAYAHSRGVLHRDLKPGNIMLGKYGETLVVDWGLAKPLGKQEVANTDEAPLVPSGQSGTAETIAGKPMGTPQFMSPEQAKGRLDLLGPASDVYSLGATLYVLLTGKPAFTDPALEVVFQKVQSGDFPPPRQVERSVPQALEAICVKAMALKPEDRYATPRALADEIERWLADEPVAAFRDHLPARIARWARRHRTAVTAAVAALLVAVVGLVAATVLLTAANERERHAKSVALEKEKKARERFTLARQTVDKFYTKVSESPEMKAKGVEKLRAKLLGDAVEYYQQFVQDEEGQEPESQAERAKTFFRLAILEAEIGKHVQAEEHYQVALLIQKGLLSSHPTHTNGYRGDIALTLHRLGMLYTGTGRSDQAEKTYLEALPLCRELVAHHPEVTDYRVRLGYTLQNLGVLYSNKGLKDQAEKIYLEALTLCSKLVADHPDVTDHRSSLGYTLHSLATLYSNTGRNDQAEKAYLEVQTLRRRLVTDYPEDTAYRVGLCETLNNLGLLYSDTGRNNQAEKAYLEVVDLRRKLATDHPEIVRYRADLCSTLINLGRLYSQSGRSSQAEKPYLEAVVIGRKLIADYPEVPDHRWYLGLTLRNLGILYNDIGRNDQAEKFYLEGLALRRKQVADHPEVPKYCADLCNTLGNLANVYTDTGRNDQAEKVLLEGLPFRRKLAAHYLAVPEYRADLGVTLGQLGRLYSNTGRMELGEMAYNEALDIKKKLAADFPKVPGYKRNLAQSLHEFGLFLDNSGRKDRAEAPYVEALDLRKRLVAEKPDVPGYRDDLAWTHHNLGWLYCQMKRYDESAKAYQEALTIRRKLVADDPAVIDHSISLAWTTKNLAYLMRETGEYAAALEGYSRALDMLKPIVQKNPDLSTPRRELLKTYGGRARTLSKLGRVPEALQDWEQAITVRSDKDREQFRCLYAGDLSRAGEHARTIAEVDDLTKSKSVSGENIAYLATAAALAATAAQKDAALAKLDRTKRAREYADRALELLARARDAGHFKDAVNLASLKTDSDIDILRSRPDFKKLLGELEKAKAPDKPKE